MDTNTSDPNNPNTATSNTQADLNSVLNQPPKLDPMTQPVDTPPAPSFDSTLSTPTLSPPTQIQPEPADTAPLTPGIEPADLAPVQPTPLTPTDSFSTYQPTTNIPTPAPAPTAEPPVQPQTPTLDINPADPLSGLTQSQPAITTTPFPSIPPVDGSTPLYNPVPVDNTNPPQPAEQAPTDLSHLLNDNPPQNSDTSDFTTPVTQPETLVQPPYTNGAVPVIPTTISEGGQGGIPKWVIALMALLLVVVAGASAYFILGIGQNKPTLSLPAVQQPTKQTITNPPVSATSPEPNTNTATQSASFGQLNGTPNNRPATASAAELLKQRLGK